LCFFRFPLYLPGLRADELEVLFGDTSLNFLPISNSTSSDSISGFVTTFFLGFITMLRSYGHIKRRRRLRPTAIDNFCCVKYASTVTILSLSTRDVSLLIEVVGRAGPPDWIPNETLFRQIVCGRMVAPTCGCHIYPSL